MRFSHLFNLFLPRRLQNPCNNHDIDSTSSLFGNAQFFPSIANFLQRHWSKCSICIPKFKPLIWEKQVLIVFWCACWLWEFEKFGFYISIYIRSESSCAHCYRLLKNQQIHEVLSCINWIYFIRVKMWSDT